LQTADPAAEAVVGGAANATENAMEAARNAEVEDEAACDAAWSWEAAAAPAAEAGNAAVALAAWVAWASSMPEAITIAERAPLETARADAEAAVGGAANATDDAIVAARTAEVANASALALSAFGVWAAWAAVAARDTVAPVADRAAGDAVVGAASSTAWEDDQSVYYYRSRDINHRERTRHRLGRYAGQVAAWGEWRRPNRRAKRRMARLVQAGAVCRKTNAPGWPLVLFGCLLRPNCLAGSFWRAAPFYFFVCPLCRDEEERRHQRHLSQ